MVMQQPKIKQLIHRGIIIPAYEPRGFSVRHGGKRIQLDAETEEMAVNWVRKLGTDYVKDPVFVRNFFRDFSTALGLERAASPDEFDFSEIARWVEEEKAAKERMTSEEKKRLAEERKKVREANKEKYGYATINGERVEIGNYMAEPPSIFMGRGKHPLRGRWKPRIKYSDITLNLSPDAPTPRTPTGEGWGGRTFENQALWIAKWRDKLIDEMKYIWVADSARIKQVREIEKFDAARTLEKNIENVRGHIESNLTSEDPIRRKVATAAYLIDVLKLRVGDEKESDEADTVGATTLRGSHVKINHDGTVKFDFVGKDFVRWVKQIGLPRQVIENLKTFMGGPNEQIFKGVRSDLVNDFLNEAMLGLTAKVFRTYHATKTVEDYLAEKELPPSAPDAEKKYVATMANLQAAMACHHKRKLPPRWKESLAKKEERIHAAGLRLREIREKQHIAEAKETEAFHKRVLAKTKRINILRETLEALKKKSSTRSRRKRMTALRKTISDERKRLEAVKREFNERKKLRIAARAEQVTKMRASLEEAERKLELARETKNYNLGTSMKSYIDPRAFAYWAENMGYDWKKIYPKSLHKKFAWVEKSGR